MSALKEMSDNDTARTSTDPNYTNAVTLGVGGVLVTLTNALVSYRMKPTDHLVRAISGTGEDATGLIILPSLAEAAGQFYYIIAPTGSSGDDISLVDAEDASEVADMDADGDEILLFSTGLKWIDVSVDGVA